jgi:hypothetical protein
MGIHHLLKDERFNIFFSFIVGLGIICIIRPRCVGAACNVNKAPEDKDFEKHVYRMGGGKCYEFKTEMTACPASGAIESFVGEQDASKPDASKQDASKPENANAKDNKGSILRSLFAARATPIRQ